MNNLHQKADERLQRVLAWASGAQGSLRTHLDEWAAFEAGGELLTRGGRQRWFNNPCPWREWSRLACHMDWLTPAAAAILRRGRERDPAVRKPRRGDVAPFRIIVEHAVPVKVIGEAVRRDTQLWSMARLREFLRHHYKRGVLTSEEDKQLTTAGLRQAMPSEWNPWDDPFARYHAVPLFRAEVGARGENL